MLPIPGFDYDTFPYMIAKEREHVALFNLKSKFRFKLKTILSKNEFGETLISLGSKRASSLGSSCLSNGEASQRIALEEDGYYVSILELSHQLMHNLADFHAMNDFVTESYL
jgi:hypothetical protein